MIERLRRWLIDLRCAMFAHEYSVRPHTATTGSYIECDVCGHIPVPPTRYHLETIDEAAERERDAR